MTYDINRQYQFIEYTKQFAIHNSVNIHLGGSFKKGTATAYSDIDLYMITDDEKLVRNFIYGYGKTPVYISNTVNPMGILIVVYSDGVSLDLSVGRLLSCKSSGALFHTEGTDHNNFVLNTGIHKNIVLSDRKEYLMSRLFHRSLIKYLSGKDNAALNILKEIADFLCLPYSDSGDYKSLFDFVYTVYCDRYSFPCGLGAEICNLYNHIIF